ISNSDQDYRATEDTEFADVPIVMIANRSSASASEIVTGALQDHDRAYVVGETTFGKALVQSVYRIDGNAGLALTTAHYYTPSGRKAVKQNFIVTDEVLADFRQQLVADGVKIDEAGFTQDLDYIKAMIRFEIDIALFGIGDAWRHLIMVDPQAQMALSQFGEAQKLLELNRAAAKNR